MLILIIISVITTVTAIVLGLFSDDIEIFQGLSLILGVVAMVVILSLIPFTLLYHGAKYKAEIINREFGTEYTQEEVFYADDVIGIIQQIKRQRIELDITSPKE